MDEPEAGMTPRHDRDPFGWNGPARLLLISTVASLGSGLAWASRGASVGPVELPMLSVDANSAPLPVLGALPGLGPVLAARIVEARPFATIDDFDRRVRGIGPAKVGALRPFLRFDPPRQVPIP